MIYGLTRSRELVDIFKKLGLGISYQDIKKLYPSWTKSDVEKGASPPEIAENVPGVVIMDNDDFKSDTLIGKSENVMFVQSENLVNSKSLRREKPTLVTLKPLKDNVDDLNKEIPYKTTKKVTHQLESHLTLNHPPPSIFVLTKFFTLLQGCQKSMKIPTHRIKILAHLLDFIAD